jgi:heat shock protein HslJ
MNIRTALGSALIVIVAACGGGGASPSASSSGSLAPSAVPSDGPAPSASAGAFDPSGPWLLTSGSADGQPIPMVEGTPITFEVQGSNVSGQSACNQYFGSIVVDGGVVRIDGLGGTEMACEEPVMQAEAAYLAALARVTAARQDGEALVLLGDGVELRFERLLPPPTAEIVGTNWILESLVMGDAVASTIGEPAMLVLRNDGTLAGFTGCRTFEGRYVISGDEVEFTDFALEGECAGGPADQDAHIVDVLEGGFRASADGQALTLSGDGNVGLIYRAEPVE